MRRSTLVMALCALTFALAGCTRNSAEAKASSTVNFITGPSFLPQCSDGVNNDPWEDQLKDSEDPDCHTDGNASNKSSYNPNDNDEYSGRGSGSQGSLPGAFQLNDGTCTANVAKLNWAASSGVEYYQIWRQSFTNGAPGLAKDRIPSNVTTLEVQADANATNYWKVVAVNGAGQTSSTVAPGVRTDVPGMVFACGAPTPPPPVATNPGGGNPPPTGGGGGTTNPPPDGGACSGASASIPGGTYSKSAGSVAITYSVPAACQWIFTSSDPAKVSVDPNNGTGPGAKPRAFFLNVGTATVCFFGVCSNFNITP